MVERTRETTDPAALLFPLFDVFSRLPKKKAEERTPGAGTSASTSLDPDTPSSSSSSTTTSSPPVAPAFLISPFYPPIASASSNLVGVGFSTPCKGLYTRCASVRVDYLSPSVYVQEDGRFVLRVFFFLRNFFFFSFLFVGTSSIRRFIFRTRVKNFICEHHSSDASIREIFC